MNLKLILRGKNPKNNNKAPGPRRPWQRGVLTGGYLGLFWGFSRLSPSQAAREEEGAGSGVALGPSGSPVLEVGGFFGFFLFFLTLISRVLGKQREETEARAEPALTGKDRARETPPPNSQEFPGHPPSSKRG